MTSSRRTSTTTVDALQGALGAQHAAVHVLGHLGGVVSATTEPDLHALLRERHQWHRDLRDRLVVAVRNAGAVPTPAAAAYALPDAEDAPATRLAGGEVEERCCQAYAVLVAASSTELRATASEALVATARAMVAWGVAPVSFPGAPELA